MTARRDPDRLIRTYLDDGPTELPDHSYDAVRTEIDHTRQRVVFGPWRESQMFNFARFAIAAAAVVVVAVVGFNFLPKGGGVGNAPSPSPTASPTASPSPAPTASPAPLPVSGAVAAGTYYRVEGDHGLTFTVPAGWTAEEQSFLYRDKDQPSEVLFVTWIVTHIFTDSCKWGTLVDAGTTVDELVTALAAQKGNVAAAPSDTTIGGFPAKRIDLTTPADVEVSTCSRGFLRYWPDPGPNLAGGFCCNAPGNTDEIYVVDVPDKRLVVIARHYPGSTAQNLAELQSIVDSLRIEQ